MSKSHGPNFDDLSSSSSLNPSSSKGGCRPREAATILRIFGERFQNSLNSARGKLTILAIIVILLIGGFFRFYLITEIPPGLYPDEAMNGNNALAVLATGNFKVFYPENNGREGLYIALLAPALAVFGNKPWTIRIVSAISGTLAILGIYLLTKELLRINFQLPIFGHKKSHAGYTVSQADNLKIGEIIALLAAFFLATSFWHLIFSRIGFRGIMVPFFATFGMYFLLKGLRRGSIFDLIWAGVFMGMGFYTYIAFRFMIFVFVVPLIWYLCKWRQEARKEGLEVQNKYKVAQNRSAKLKTCAPCAVLLFLFVVFVITLPLGWYFLQNPQDFVGRASSVSVFSAKEPFNEFLNSFALTLQMFFWQGDCNWRHNYNCAPELHPLVAFFFIIGFFVVIRNLFNSQSNFEDSVAGHLKTRKFKNSLKFENWRVGNLLLLTWFFSMSLPAALTREGLPHALRSIGMVTPVMIFAGLGAWWIIQKILGWFDDQKIKWPQYARKLTRIKKEIVFLFVLVLAFIPPAVYRNYFLQWAGNSNTYFAFSTNIWHLGKFLDDLPDETKKYVVTNLAGVEVNGIPMPAQTVMFATDTFREERQKERNLFYLNYKGGASIIDEVDYKGDAPVVIAFLNSEDKELIGRFRKRFSSFKVKAPADFIILEKN